MKQQTHKGFTKTLDSQLGETRKPQQRSLQDGHQEILRNLQSTIIGKPTIVEAQRVLKVLDSLIFQFEMCSFLDAEFVGRFFSGKFQKDLIQNLTEDTLTLLQHQAEIEQKYRPYANLDQALKEGEEIDEAKKIESERLEKLLKENFKDLLRRLQHIPKDYEIIRTLKPNINPELSDLVHCVKCMKIVMLKKLSTAQEEQNNHVKQLEELKQKISTFEKSKNQLEQELQKLRQERTQNMNKMKEEIEKLKNSISEVKATKQRRQDNLSKDIQSKYDGLEKEHKTKEDKLMAELQLLRSKFQKMKDENAQEESQLKRRKQAQDQLQVDALQNYDFMMEEKTKELGDLKNECEEIQKQLKDKQEHFAAVDGERARERNIEEEYKRIKEMHKINQEKKWESALHIQAFLQQVKKPSKKGGKKTAKK